MTWFYFPNSSFFNKTFTNAITDCVFAIQPLHLITFNNFLSIKLSIHKVGWLIFFQEMVFCCSSFFPWSVFGVFLVCVFPHLDWIRRHGLSLRILSKYGKMRTRITPNMDTFYTVIVHFVVLGVSLWQRAFSQME